MQLQWTDCKKYKCIALLSNENVSTYFFFLHEKEQHVRKLKPFNVLIWKKYFVCVDDESVKHLWLILQRVQKEHKFPDFTWYVEGIYKWYISSNVAALQFRR